MKYRLAIGLICIALCSLGIWYASNQPPMDEKTQHKTLASSQTSPPSINGEHRFNELTPHRSIEHNIPEKIAQQASQEDRPPLPSKKPHSDKALWDIWNGLMQDVKAGKISKEEADEQMRQIKQAQSNPAHAKAPPSKGTDGHYAWSQDPDWHQLDDEAQVQRIFDHIDKNGDLFIDLSELRPFEINEDVFNRFDADQDRMIDSDEWMNVKRPLPIIQENG